MICWRNKTSFNLYHTLALIVGHSQIEYLHQYISDACVSQFPNQSPAVIFLPVHPESHTHIFALGLTF